MWFLVGLVRLKVARYRCGLPISVKEEMAGAVGVTRSELERVKPKGWLARLTAALAKANSNNSA